MRTQIAPIERIMHAYTSSRYTDELKPSVHYLTAHDTNAKDPRHRLLCV
jgi:hypothetical protein